MANLKFSQFTEQTDTSNVQFIVGYNGATNVRISPANISGAYLPLAGGTLTGNYLTLIDIYIKPILIHYGFMRALPYLGITIANGGIYRNSAENATALSKDEVEYLVEAERDAAQYYSTRMIDYLNFNASANFPEYFTNQNEDISPDYDDNFNGWYLR